MTVQTWPQGREAPAYEVRSKPTWSNGRQAVDGERMAQYLGWFSVALGVAQLVAPRRIAHLIGIRGDNNDEAMLRAIGLRELTSGIGILTHPHSPEWLQARVGGDAMDLALLATKLNGSQSHPDRVATTMAVVASVTALDMRCQQQLRQADREYPAHQERLVYLQRGEEGVPSAVSVPHERGIRVESFITIHRTPAELYQYWRNFENLPNFMNHLESVQVLDEGRSRWRAKAPLGMTVSWDAEIIDDTENERISWRSLAGSNLPNAGSVQFKPAVGGRGTVVTVKLEYDPPGGAVGATLAKLFGEEPNQQVRNDLRIFKQVMETGEIVRSDASLRGAPLHQRSAQPAPEKTIERAIQ